MQLLTTTVLQFIFMFLSLIIGVPGSSENNLLKNKLLLFCGFFVFQIVVNSITNTQKRCNSNISNLFNDSLFVALLSIIGYSIYIDLVTMKSTQNLVFPYLQNSHLSSLLITGIVVSFIFLVKVFQIVFIGKEECNNNNNYEITY